MSAPSENVRVRLHFVNLKDFPKHLPIRCWLLVNTRQSLTISDVENLISARFGLKYALKLELSLDDCLLPSWESAKLLRDGDELSVTGLSFEVTEICKSSTMPEILCGKNSASRSPMSMTFSPGSPAQTAAKSVVNIVDNGLQNERGMLASETASIQEKHLAENVILSDTKNMESSSALTCVNHRSQMDDNTTLGSTRKRSLSCSSSGDVSVDGCAGGNESHMTNTPTTEVKEPTAYMQIHPCNELVPAEGRNHTLIEQTPEPKDRESTETTGSIEQKSKRKRRKRNKNKNKTPDTNDDTHDLKTDLRHQHTNGKQFKPQRSLHTQPPPRKKTLTNIARTSAWDNKGHVHFDSSEDESLADEKAETAVFKESMADEKAETAVSTESMADEKAETVVSMESMADEKAETAVSTESMADEKAVTAVCTESMTEEETERAMLSVDEMPFTGRNREEESTVSNRLQRLADSSSDQAVNSHALMAEPNQYGPKSNHEQHKNGLKFKPKHNNRKQNQLGNVPVFSRKKMKKAGSYAVDFDSNLCDKISNVATIQKDDASPAESKPEKVPDPPKDYSPMPLLQGPPSSGDTIAYKILEIDEQYCPVLSSYKEALVVQYDPLSNSVEVELKTTATEKKTPGRFDITIEDENEILTNTQAADAKVKLSWTSLVEPRLVTKS